MLIDAGDNSKGTAVQLYLKKQGITSLDYVIGTHPDSDHIGGLDVVIYKFDCKNILMPDCKNDTATYRDVIDSMKSKGYKAVHPKTGTKYSLGDATFTITGPVKKYKETNDNSISLRLVYQDTSFLFMGDATADTEPDIIAHTKNLRSDVLKVAQMNREALSRRATAAPYGGTPHLPAHGKQGKAPSPPKKRHTPAPQKQIQKREQTPQPQRINPYRQKMLHILLMQAQKNSMSRTVGASNRCPRKTYNTQNKTGKA